MTDAQESAAWAAGGAWALATIMWAICAEIHSDGMLVLAVSTTTAFSVSLGVLAYTFRRKK